MTDVEDPASRAAASAPTDQKQLIVAGLEGLPCLTRAVFLLHRLDGLSYEEIAWRCGISGDEVLLRVADGLTGVRRSCNGNPTLVARFTRAMRSWRFEWVRWRRERRDRQLGL